ncbi:MAG: tRNA (5-methylaminomethyl-2-thiouridine)(34)-methyltransferase MnmD [Flavobacteriales bacterium]|nr:tRNA (5-methylaminomethyl-2-thiouridine)(34)-methyltransferase MnmD [Flavobacteriales bacterium]
MKKVADQEWRIEPSADGSPTLYSHHFKSHFHSIHGAIQESEHVFIEHCLQRIGHREITLIEIGFGTGLNALLSLIFAMDNGIHTTYHTYEAFPLPEAIYSQLDYCRLLDCEDLKSSFIQMHASSWDAPLTIGDHLTLVKHQEDFLQADFPEGVHGVYFDAFGPGTQPELWNEEMFERLYGVMEKGAVLSTYSSKGDVRRAMQSVGFEVEKVPGPPGKREMLVAFR